MGHPIIMGRKTYDAIGKPLPGRTNIVVSRNPAYKLDGCIVVDNVEAAINHSCRLSDEVFVIGGATLYEATLPIANALYITQINQEFEGDTFFPEFDHQQWTEVERQEILTDASVSFTYDFIVYDKTN